MFCVAIWVWILPYPLKQYGNVLNRVYTSIGVFYLDQGISQFVVFFRNSIETSVEFVSTPNTFP